MGFFKSFFSGKPDSPEAEKQKAIQKKFEAMAAIKKAVKEAN